jgi:hypothetical protein
VASRAESGGVRVTGVRIAGLSTQPPFANPSVAVFCRGLGCPFGGRFFRASGGRLAVGGFGRRALRPGTVIEIKVIKGNFVGSVQRYEVKGRRLAVSRLCAYPTQLDPQPCQPG